MLTKDDCKRKYAEYKATHGQIPEWKQFLEFAKIGRQGLITLFGRNAYSTLQNECGDAPNKLDITRTPLDVIMRNYGNLALELASQGILPNSSDWRHRKLRPSVSGLKRPPHEMGFSEFPKRFLAWVETERVHGYESVVDLIRKSSANQGVAVDDIDREFQKVIDEIRIWSPARRRNTEESSKVELRAHLKLLGYEVKEEYGESNFDLLIGDRFVVEIKKDPSLGEYDRLFGQLARHLQHQLLVIALIFDAPSADNFAKFASLVDSYPNNGNKVVEIIKK